MNKVSGVLGLAKRARKIASGDSIWKSIQSKGAKLVLISDDIGDNQKKKLIDKCSYYKVSYCFISSELLNQAIGEYNKKAIAILDEGFATKLQTYLKG